jgi:hypothetical protein
MTVLRTKLTVTGGALGASTGRAKSAVDDLGTLTFAADSAGAAVINTVVVTFSGSAASAAAFLDNVQLYDPSTGSNLGTSNTTSTACNGSTTCTKTFRNIGYTVSAGSSKVFNIRLNSSAGTFAAGSGISATLSATINAATDVSYTDGSDSAAVSNIGLPSALVPITVNSVSYAQGT